MYSYREEGRALSSAADLEGVHRFLYSVRMRLYWENSWNRACEGFGDDQIEQKYRRSHAEDLQ
jgi:hypothetical protein